MEARGMLRDRTSHADLGGGGTNASAEAVISNGVVTSVNLTNVGSSYTSAPQVVFSGGSGQGATAEALDRWCVKY